MNFITSGNRNGSEIEFVLVFVLLPVIILIALFAMIVACFWGEQKRQRMGDWLEKFIN